MQTRKAITFGDMDCKVWLKIITVKCDILEEGLITEKYSTKLGSSLFFSPHKH